MADWGVPDWRDANAYPEPERTTIREWWWEFTRRRPDYRDMWGAANALEGKPYRYAPDHHELELKFGLSVIHDPAIGLTDCQLRQFRFPRNFARSPREMLAEQVDDPHVDHDFATAISRGKMAEAEGNMLYNFDLSHPLKPQLEQAENYLKKVQKELYPEVVTQRPRPENWREFLRVIDAREDGATYREIRDVFWPDRAERADGKALKTEGSIRDIYNAACKLRDNFPL